MTGKITRRILSNIISMARGGVSCIDMGGIKKRRRS